MHIQNGNAGMKTCLSFSQKLVKGGCLRYLDFFVHNYINNNTFWEREEIYIENKYTSWIELL